MGHLIQVVEIALGDLFGSSMTATIVLAVVVILGLVGKWHHNRIRGARRIVEPSDLIVVGLVGVILCGALALAGYIFQSRQTVATIAPPAAPPGLTQEQVVQKVDVATKPLKDAIAERDKQIVALQSQLGAQAATSHTTRYSKAEIIRLQSEVFAIHGTLNTAEQQLKAPLNEWAQTGMVIVDRDGNDKSIAMLNSYIGAVQDLRKTIVEDNPQNLRFDWNELGPLTGDDARQTIENMLAFLNQYKRVLERSGTPRSDLIRSLLQEQRNMESFVPEFLAWLSKSRERCETKKTELQSDLQNAID